MILVIDDLHPRHLHPSGRREPRPHVHRRSFHLGSLFIGNALPEPSAALYIVARSDLHDTTFIQITQHRNVVMVFSKTLFIQPHMLQSLSAAPKQPTLHPTTHDSLRTAPVDS